MDPVEISAVIKDVLVGTLIILSLALTGIGYLSWSRSRSPRIAMVTTAFLIFLLKGIFLAVGLYLTDWISVPKDFALAFDVMLISDFLVLTMLYLALFRKKGSDR